MNQWLHVFVVDIHFGVQESHEDPEILITDIERNNQGT